MGSSRVLHPGGSQVPPSSRPARSGGSSPVFSSSSLDWKRACLANTPMVDASLKMDFIPPSIVDGKRAISLTEEEVLDAENRWRNSLIGYVLGNRPYFPKLKEWILRFWKPKASFEVFSRENGFFVFQFGSEEDKNFVLEHGPWFIHGKPFILRNWDASSGLDRDLLSSAPVWIRLYGINLKASSRSSITKMASFVGKPLMMDKSTANMSRMDYARCLVEVDAAQLPPTQISVYLPDGTSYEQSVFYEYLPARCNLCSSFGHTDPICPSSQPSQPTMHSTGASQDTVRPAETAVLQPNQSSPDAVDLIPSSSLERAAPSPRVEASTVPHSANPGSQPNLGSPSFCFNAGAVGQIQCTTPVPPVLPSILTTDFIDVELLKKTYSSPQESEDLSEEDGEVSSEQPAGSLDIPTLIPRRKMADFRSKSREERFQDLRSFSSQLGQKLAKSAISKVSFSDLPQDQEQQEVEEAPFIEVIRKKSKRARGKGAGDQIRASPRIVKPNPKYL